MKSLQRIIAIVFQEFLQLYRDRISTGLVVSIPLILMLLFGYTLHVDVHHLPISVVDDSNSVSSQALVEALIDTQLIKVVRKDRSPELAAASLKRGEIRAALLLPEDMEQRMMDGSIPAQWLIDSSDIRISSAILKLQKVPPAIGPGVKDQPPSPLFETTLFYNPERRPAITTIPGLITIILTITMILFSSISLVRDREQGCLETLMATPIVPLELLIGKMTPLIVTGLLQAIIILAIARLAFAVPINGSLIDILVVTILFLAAILPLGLIVSALVENQLQATQMAILIILPSILLSGFTFPFEAMPLAGQWLSEVLPTTHYRRLMFGLISRGADLGLLLKDTLWLFFLTLMGWTVAAKLFRKSLHDS